MGIIWGLQALSVLMKIVWTHFKPKLSLKTFERTWKKTKMCTKMMIMFGYCSHLLLPVFVLRRTQTKTEDQLPWHLLEGSSNIIRMCDVRQFIYTFQTTLTCLSWNVNKVVFIRGVAISKATLLFTEIDWLMYTVYVPQHHTTTSPLTHTHAYSTAKHWTY